MNFIKILNPTKSELFDFPIIIPGLKTFILDECSGRYKVSTTRSNHIAHAQICQGDGRKISTDASQLNQGGEGGTDFHGKPIVKDDRSSQS